MTDTISWDQVWNQRISAFAMAIGSEPSAVVQAIEVLVGPPSQVAVELLQNPKAVTFEDLSGVFTRHPFSVDIRVFRKKHGLLRGFRLPPISST